MKGMFLYEVRKRHERGDLTESYILKQFSFCNGKNTFNNFIILFTFVSIEDNFCFFGVLYCVYHELLF